MDASSKFLNDPEQPTRHDPATGALFSTDTTIVHAAHKDRFNWKQLDNLSSDHCPILIAIHLQTEKLRGDKRLVWDWKKGDWAAFTTAVDEQRGSGLTDGKS